MQNERAHYVFDEYLSTDDITGKLLLLIKGASFFSSVMNEWGYRTHYPIAVVTETLEIGDAIADKLAIFNRRVFSTNTPPGEFLKALSDVHDDLCIMTYTPGRYLSDDMDTIFCLCQCGEYDGCEAGGIIMVIFPKVVAKEYKEKFSLIIEIGQEHLENLNRSKMEAYLDILRSNILTHEQIIEHEIHKNLQRGFDRKDERFWYAVVTVLAVVFSDGKAVTEETIRSHLCYALKMAYDKVDSYEFDCQIPDLFREVFAESIPEVSKFRPEPNAVDFSEQELTELVLYDSERYYIPDALFAKICKPLTDTCICTVNQIKNVLAAEGILCTQGQGRIYKTIKKNVGILNTPLRFVWLKREALEEGTMEMSFVDLYLIREAKRNDK